MDNFVLNQIEHAVKNTPNSCALYVDGSSYSYAEFYNAAAQLAQNLRSIGFNKGRCAIFSRRSVHAYKAILANVILGSCYVPLNLNFPLEKNLAMIAMVKPDVICIDIDEIEIIKEVIAAYAGQIILFSSRHLQELRQCFPQRMLHFWQEQKIINQSIFCKQITATDHAYIMFTSGSTGAPKAVAVTYGNLSAYISSLLKKYEFYKSDRVCQFSELTFDLSVHDIFSAWCSGAALYVFPEKYLFGVKKFIQKHQITVWLSVPSIIFLFKKMNFLGKKLFPSLRLCFFCGEPLLFSQAQAWHLAATNALIVNIYGPTEATISFIHYALNDVYKQSNEIVPIGVPLLNQHCAIINELDQLCLDGEVGELCLAGSQVVNQYLIGSDKSQQNFCQFNWDEEKLNWYRTGDYAYRDHAGIYHYIGRVDDQWQVRGYRVEKNEIEFAIRNLVKHSEVAVVPIRQLSHQCIGICAFIVGEFDSDKLFQRMRKTLPDVIVPKKIIKLIALPKNANGKIDYAALVKKISVIDKSVDVEVLVNE